MKNNFEDTMILPNINNKPILKNHELMNWIQFKLDKTYIEKNDLTEIKDIVMNGKTITGDINIVDFNELDLFPNLKKIELKNLQISIQNMEKLKMLETISFKNCKIESLESIKNVKNMSINNCEIDDFYLIVNFIDLEELEIINMPISDFEFLKNLKNLKVLKLKNIKEFSLNTIKFNLPIKYLSLEGINDIDEQFIIGNYPKLECLSIERDKKDEWIEKLKNIKQHGIKILINDIYEY